MFEDIFVGSDGKWYFWNEDEIECLGPFDTQTAAEIALDDYIWYLGTGAYQINSTKPQWLQS